ncbi:MAG: FMN-binding negative transcriptional regulator [Alphaproteobacteria bacterium]|nr:FMN-binding negative transcriptional regulator [Alphaproteobacteria bacterium]
MYRPKAFVVDDPQLLRDFIRRRSFATIAAVIDGAAALAYAPVLLHVDEHRDIFRFHLAKSNPVASVADGEQLTFSFLGPDTYVSPDWYASKGFVPTWNYAAIEGRGAVRRLSDDATHRLLVDLSAMHEGRLAPKAPWTMDKTPPEKVKAMLQAIVGFEVAITSLQGKFKLSQDKKPEDVAGVIAALEAQSDGRARHIAAVMRRWNPKR